MRNLYSLKRIFFIFIFLIIIRIPLFPYELRIRISCLTELVIECNDAELLNEVVKLQFDQQLSNCTTQPANVYKLKIDVSYSTSTKSERINRRQVRQPITGNVIREYYTEVKTPICTCKMDIAFYGKDGFVVEKKLQKKAVGYYKDKRYPCSRALSELHTELSNIILDFLIKEIQVQNTPPTVLNTYLIKLLSSKKNAVIKLLKKEKFRTSILNIEYWLKNIATNFQDTCSFLSFIDYNKTKNIDFIKQYFNYYDSYSKKESISNIFPSLNLIKNKELLFSYLVNRNVISDLDFNELKDLLSEIIDLSARDSLFEQSFLSYVENRDYANSIKRKPNEAFFEIDKFTTDDFESFSFINAIDDIINAHSKSDKNLKKALYKGLFLNKDSKYKLFFYINDCCQKNLYLHFFVRDYAEYLSKYVSSEKCYLFKWYLSVFISNESRRGMQLKEKYFKEYYHSAKIFTNCYSFDYVKSGFKSVQWTYFGKPYNKHMNRLLNYLKKRYNK